MNIQMFIFNLDPCAQKVDLRHSSESGCFRKVSDFGEKLLKENVLFLLVIFVFLFR